MSKCVIYQDEKSSVYFCKDGRIFFKDKDSYVNAKDALEALNSKVVKFLPGMQERKKEITKLLSMCYKDAAKYHLNSQLAKGRKGKLFDGEFNGK